MKKLGRNLIFKREFHHDHLQSLSSTITMNNNVKVPVLALGTWKSRPHEVQSAVEHAIKIGYRHIDCAERYENEAEIGQAIHHMVHSRKVKREDLFITTKIFNNNHEDRVQVGLDKSLEDLRLDYVDLLLMHWPIKFLNMEEINGPVRKPDGHPDPALKMVVEYLDTWKEMERMVKLGKARSIGVSNFEESQLKDLLAHCKIKPCVNQIEFHPFLVQKSLCSWGNRHGIVTAAYSPLGSSDSISGKRENAPKLLSHPHVHKLSQRYHKTPAQVLIRWSLQHGNICIPKSVNPERINENADVFDFRLSEADMEELDSLNRDHRFGMGWMPGHYYPLPHTPHRRHG